LVGSRAEWRSRRKSGARIEKREEREKKGEEMNEHCSSNDRISDRRKVRLCDARKEVKRKGLICHI